MDTGQIASACSWEEQKKRGGFLIFLVYYGVKEQLGKGGKATNNTGDDDLEIVGALVNTQRIRPWNTPNSKNPPAQPMTQQPLQIWL